MSNSKSCLSAQEIAEALYRETMADCRDVWSMSDESLKRIHARMLSAITAAVAQREQDLGLKEPASDLVNAVLQKEVALSFVVEAVTLLQEIETSKLRALGLNVEPIALTKARLKLVRVMQVLYEGKISEQTRRDADSVLDVGDQGEALITPNPVSAAVAAVKEEDAKALDLTEPHPEATRETQKTVSVGVVDKGHIYRLPSFDGRCEQVLTFMKREGVGYPGNIGSHPGTNLQSVIRACIDRVLYLNDQIPHDNNTAIVSQLRHCLLELEQRAAERHGRSTRISLNLASEGPMCAVCGHVVCGHSVGRGNATGASPGNPKSGSVAAPQAEATGAGKCEVCQQVIRNAQQSVFTPTGERHWKCRDSAPLVKQESKL